MQGLKELPTVDFVGLWAAFLAVLRLKLFAIALVLRCGLHRTALAPVLRKEQYVPRVTEEVPAGWVSGSFSFRVFGDIHQGLH